MNLKLWYVHTNELSKLFYVQKSNDFQMSRQILVVILENKTLQKKEKKNPKTKSSVEYRDQYRMHLYISNFYLYFWFQPQLLEYA